MGTIGNVFFAGISMDIYIDNTAVGYTEDGIKDNHTVEYYDVEADQSINVLKKFKIKERKTIQVNVEEATLDNIKIAMGEENSISNDGSWKRLSFGGGVTVTEHTLKFEATDKNSTKVRKLHIYKAVAIEVGEMAYKKGEKTIVPVTFECIADTTKPEGEQYGYYENQV